MKTKNLSIFLLIFLLHFFLQDCYAINYLKRKYYRCSEYNLSPSSDLNDSFNQNAFFSFPKKTKDQIFIVSKIAKRILLDVYPTIANSAHNLEDVVYKIALEFVLEDDSDIFNSAENLEEKLKDKCRKKHSSLLLDYEVYDFSVKDPLSEENKREQPIDYSLTYLKLERKLFDLFYYGEGEFREASVNRIVELIKVGMLSKSRARYFLNKKVLIKLLTSNSFKSRIATAKAIKAMLDNNIIYEQEDFKENVTLESIFKDSSQVDVSLRIELYFLLKDLEIFEMEINEKNQNDYIPINDLHLKLNEIDNSNNQDDFIFINHILNNGLYDNDGIMLKVVKFVEKSLDSSFEDIQIKAYQLMAKLLNKGYLYSDFNAEEYKKMFKDRLIHSLKGSDRLALTSSHIIYMLNNDYTIKTDAFAEHIPQKEILDNIEKGFNLEIALALQKKTYGIRGYIPYDLIIDKIPYNSIKNDLESDNVDIFIQGINRLIFLTTNEIIKTNEEIQNLFSVESFKKFLNLDCKELTKVIDAFILLLNAKILKKEDVKISKVLQSLFLLSDSLNENDKLAFTELLFILIKNKFIPENITIDSSKRWYSRYAEEYSKTLRHQDLYKWIFNNIHPMKAPQVKKRILFSNKEKNILKAEMLIARAVNLKFMGQELNKEEIPDIKGFQTYNLYKKRPSKIGWDLRDGVVPGITTKEDGSINIIDLEKADENFIVSSRKDNGRMRSSTNTLFIVKGVYNNREIVALIQEDDFSKDFIKNVQEWSKNSGFIPKQVFMFYEKHKKEKDEDDDVQEVIKIDNVDIHYLECSTNSPLALTSRSFAYIDQNGEKKLFELNKEKNLFLEENIQYDSVDKSQSFDNAVKQGIIFIISEYVRQTGFSNITNIQLEKILDKFSTSALKVYLQKIYFKDKDMPKNFWGQALAAFISPFVMPVIHPQIREKDDLRSLYWGAAAYSRTPDYHRSNFIGKIIQELDDGGVYSKDGIDFLRSALINNGIDDTFSTQGIGGHDDYDMVKGYFPVFSRLPFLMLQQNYSLLSIVGGYGSNKSFLFKILCLEGFDEIVASNFKNSDKRRDNSGNIGFGSRAAAFNLMFKIFTDYKNREDFKGSYADKMIRQLPVWMGELMDKYGFNYISNVYEKYQEKTYYILECFYYAIELIKKSKDYDLNNNDSVISKIATLLLKTEASSMPKLFTALSHLIKSKDDLLLEKKGSFAFYIHELKKELEKNSSISIIRYFTIISILQKIGKIVENKEELNTYHKGSIVSHILKADILDELKRANDLVEYVFPNVNNKNEFIQILNSFNHWKRHEQTLDSLLPERYKDYSEFGFNDKERAELVKEIIISKVTRYSVIYNEALTIKEISNIRYDDLRKFLINREIDLRVRMTILEEYLEMIIVDKAFVYKRQAMQNEDSNIKPEDKELIETLDNRISMCNKVLNDIIKNSIGNKSQVRKKSKKISKIIDGFRFKMFEYIIGRELTNNDKTLISDTKLSKDILRIMRIIISLHFGDNKLASEIFKRAILKMFDGYNQNEDDSIKKAIQRMNQWILNLGLEEYIEMQSISNREDIENLKIQYKNHKANKEIIDELVEHGYKRELFTNGISVNLIVSEGISLKEKKEQILSATFELVEIAMSLGVTLEKGKELSLDYADKLDSYLAANQFCKTIIVQGKVSEDMNERLRTILETVENIERIETVEDLQPHKFLLTIKKDYLKESLAGVGVPGCFAPNGLHREMPLVHASEANVGFMQVFTEEGSQVANAVVIYSNEGAFIYPGFQSNEYTMQELYTEGLKKLSKYVPKVIFKGDSAGALGLINFAKKDKFTLNKPGVIFQNQYFDFGKHQEDGTLILEGDFNYVTEDTIKAKNGFALKPIIKVERSEEFPTIRWQDLAEMFINPDFKKYPFLKGLEAKNMFTIIGKVKRKISDEGYQAINEEFYEWIYSNLDPQIDNLDKRIKDGIADLVIDFLELQEWPMEFLTPLNPTLEYIDRDYLPETYDKNQLEQEKSKILTQKSITEAA